MRIQLFTNLAFSILRASLLLISVSIAEKLLPVALLGGLLLFRRQGALASNLLQLGASQNVQRFCTNNEASPDLNAYGASFRIAGLGIILTCLVGLIFGVALGPFLLGDELAGEINWFFIFIISLIISYVTVTTWQSRFNFFAANMAEILVGSFVFLITVVFWRGSELSSLIRLFSLLTLFSSFVVFVFLVLSVFKGRVLKLIALAVHSKLNVKQFRFGLTRGASAFLDLSLFAVGPWMIRNDLKQSGYLILALIFIRFVQTLVTPLSQVMSLRLVAAGSEGTRDEKTLLFLLALVLSCGLLSVLVFLSAGHFIIELWLSESSAYVHRYIKSIIFYIPGIAGFYLLRNYVDLNFVRAVNLYFLIFCQALFAVTFLVIQKLFDVGIINATILSMQVMFSSFYAYIVVIVVYLLKNMGSHDKKRNN